MTQHRDPENSFIELRRRAEPTLAGKAGDAVDLSALTPEEVQELVHQLQVRQLELEELKDRYRDLYDFAPVAYVTLGDKGLVVEANLTAVRLLGTDRQNLIEKPFSLFVCREFGEAFRLHLQKVLEAESKQSCEIKMARKDGTEFYAQLVSVAVHDENGNFRLCQVVLSDITERKQTEERLQLLDFALDHVREAAFLIDEHARFRFVNEESCRILGYTRPELLGLGVPDVDPDFPLDRWPEHWNDLKMQGSLLFESHHRTRDGHIFSVEVNANYFEFGGQGYNLALVRDITERKAAEREHLASLRFFESMDRVNKAIQGTDDLEQMMSDVLDVVLSTFDCDRTFLMYPCDPQARSCTVPMEKTKPEYPGGLSLGLELPMDEDFAETLRILLDADGPVKFDPATEHELPADVSEAFGPKAMMSTVLYPRVDKPWEFGIQACAYPRVWTQEEERLFQEIGRRLGDGLRTLLTHRDLRESQARLSEAQRIAHVGYWERDFGTDRVVLSDEACSIFGLPPHEESWNLAQWYERWLSLIHPEDRQRVGQAYVEAVASGPGYSVEYRIVRPDGEERHVHSEANVTRDESGHAIRMLDIMLDITERKRAERELQRSNDLLRAIIEAAPTAIFGLDLNANVQMVWNPAAEKMLGWSAREVIGRPLPIVPEKQQGEFRSYRERMCSGETLYGVEVTRHRRNGTPIDYSVYSSPLRDAEGRITGNVCVLVDITDRKRTEHALRASEEKYRTLFEESIDGVYSVLRDGQITDANASFCNIFGYTRQEMIGKDVRELYANPADRQRFQKEIEKRGFVKDYEVKLRKRDGTAVDCVLSSSVYFGKDGGIAGYRGVLRDLTAYKGLQRQLLQAQKMESIGTLAGGIAHDFNNLLQVVLGYCDMLLFEKNSSDPEFEELHTIRQAAKDGAELAKRILAFSKRLEPSVRPVNLNHEILRVQKMLERTLPKMIRIEILLRENVMTVNADSSQMEQVLLNLAVNAQHAMPDGGRLTIETANVTLDEDYSRTHLGVEPGRYVLLSVSDTGQGMDEKVLERVFEPFFTTKEAGEGTGLGLAMVFGIVKSHKGHIICYSVPGVGTTFKIYLPAIVREIEQDVAVSRQMPAFGTETILLVDDEERIRNIGEQMLRRAGYTVLTATNGREALEAYRSNQDRIGLVLLDLMMPEMGGKQCLEELLNIDKRVKVIIASGYSANGPTKDILASGAKRFVDKPYDMRQVLKAIREVLDAE